MRKQSEIVERDLLRRGRRRRTARIASLPKPAVDGLRVG
jgi:hypothetical protein